MALSKLAPSQSAGALSHLKGDWPVMDGIVGLKLIQGALLVLLECATCYHLVSPIASSLRFGVAPL